MELQSHGAATSPAPTLFCFRGIRLPYIDRAYHGEMNDNDASRQIAFGRDADLLCFVRRDGML